MKLQVALDFTNMKDALRVCRKVYKYVDIIELGTPLIKAEGLGIVKKFKKFRKPIVADLKTMDTGFLEAEMAFKAGADISTVSGTADLATIEGVLKAARKYKKKIYVDTIGVKDIKRILKLKPHYLEVHTSIDSQNKGKSVIDSLRKLKGLKTKLAVAGGIGLKNISAVKEYNPGVVVVGGAITKAKNPREVARKLSEVVKK